MFTLEKQTKPAMKRVAMPSEARRRDEGGFTLLEIAIALVLMAIVGLGVASVFVYAAKYNVSAGDRELAMAVAQQRIEQLRNVAFTDSSLAATPLPVTPTTVVRAGRQYSVITTIADSNVVNGQATIKTITVKVIPKSDTATWATGVSSYFGAVMLVSERSATSLGPNRAS